MPKNSSDHPHTLTWRGRLFQVTSLEGGRRASFPPDRIVLVSSKARPSVGDGISEVSIYLDTGPHRECVIELMTEHPDQVHAFLADPPDNVSLPLFGFALGRPSP